MSFGDMAELPTSLSPGASTLATLTGGISSPESAANELRSNLAALAANSAALRNCGADEVHRSRALRAQNREIAHNATALAVHLDAGADAAATEGLRARLRAQIADFSAALRESAAREQKALAADRAAASASAKTLAALPDLGKARASTQIGGNEAVPLLRVSAKELALRRELESAAALRIERADALRDINSDVADVHGIMRDLASLVGDQGTTLEYVAVNVEDSLEATSAASRELSRARRGQDGKRRLFFTLLLIVAAIIVLLLLILLI